MTAPARPFAAWDGATYLNHYYAALADDEVATLRFLVREFARAGPSAHALDFGAGPTLHHLLPLSPYAASIDVADLLADNLAQIGRWRERRPGAHDWRDFTRHVLGCEGRRDVGADAVGRREALTRARLRCLLHGDAARPQPLGRAGRRSYDIVMSCYCADSATSDKATWARYLSHVVSLLAPGGLFVLASLRRCTGYRVGPQIFPGADVDEGDIAHLLRDNGFDMRSARIDVEPAPRQWKLGYDAIVLASARRGTSAASALAFAHAARPG